MPRTRSSEIEQPSQNEASRQDICPPACHPLLQNFLMKFLSLNILTNRNTHVINKVSHQLKMCTGCSVGFAQLPVKKQVPSSILEHPTPVTCEYAEVAQKIEHRPPKPAMRVLEA